MSKELLEKVLRAKEKTLEQAGFRIIYKGAHHIKYTVGLGVYITIYPSDQSVYIEYEILPDVKELQKRLIELVNNYSATLKRISELHNKIINYREEPKLSKFNPEPFEFTVPMNPIACEELEKLFNPEPGVLYMINTAVLGRFILDPEKKEVEGCLQTLQKSHHTMKK